MRLACFSHPYQIIVLTYLILPNYYLLKLVNFSFPTYLQSVLWSIYVAVVFFISLSRLYIAAHFPHQLILGVIIGKRISCRPNYLGILTIFQASPWPASSSNRVAAWTCANASRSPVVCFSCRAPCFLAPAR